MARTSRGRPYGALMCTRGEGAATPLAKELPAVGLGHFVQSFGDGGGRGSENKVTVHNGVAERSRHSWTWVFEVASSNR